MYLVGSEVFRCVVVVLCSVILYGCASYPADYPTETKRIRDNDSISSIKPGKTTRTEVETLLGKPGWVNGYEVLAGLEEEEWVYYTIEEIIPESLSVLVVPIIIKYATSFSDEMYTLFIRFSKEGLVKQVEKCKITGPAHGDKQECESY